MMSAMSASLYAPRTRRDSPAIMAKELPFPKASIASRIVAGVANSLKKMMKRRGIIAKLFKLVGKGHEAGAARMAYLSSPQARLARARQPHRVSLSSCHDPTMPTIPEEEDTAAYFE